MTQGNPEYKVTALYHWSWAAVAVAAVHLYYQWMQFASESHQALPNDPYQPTDLVTIRKTTFSNYKSSCL